MIESVDMLSLILEPYAGQTVYNKEDKKTYRWDPVEGWQECNFEGNITMCAYDINKQIIGQLEILDEDTLRGKKELVRKYITDIKDEYYMLLCRDINYYTLFHKTPVSYGIAEDILECVLIDECLPAIGQIKSIERTEDEVIEIWLQDANSNEVYVAYFFPYGTGVIECA